MNTNETKAKIWNMCIERGVFDKVKGEDFKKIQDMFEKIIKGYEKVEPSVEIFNKVIDSIALDVQNQNQPPKPASFEDIQKEYDVLLKTPIPTKIDFTDKEPLENNIIGTNGIGTNGIGTNITARSELNQFDYQAVISQENSQTPYQNEKNENKKESKIKLEEILMTQNKILIKILETQIKIIHGLKL
uniref:Uncharacterized protein n=1 Tax=viral metagenome TaxID=1070528 RepID=A0A6C0D1T2_9ZZZZ